MNSREYLEKELDGLLDYLPATKENCVLRQELLERAESSYELLVKGGENEAAALAKACVELRDSGLLPAVPQTQGYYPDAEMPYSPQDADRAAIFSGLGTGLLLLGLLLALVSSGISSFTSFLAFSGLNQVIQFIGLAAGSVIGIVGISLLVFRANRWPKNRAAKADKKRRKRLRGNISALMWLITTILYFVISFNFGRWHISWIIFLVAALMEVVLNMVFPVKDD